MKQIKKIIKPVYVNFSRLVHEAWAVMLPALYAKYVYKTTTGKKLNLKDPQDFDEKNFWLRVNSDLSEWTELADKFKVRDYVEKCGLGHILTPFYGAWDRAEDIDFNSLPDRFVLKTNHGFGKIILVQDKSQLDIQKTRKQLNKWLRERHGLVSFEPHYWNISRKIIAEEFLEDNKISGFSSSLIDYKFFCINGEPEIIKVMHDRNTKPKNKDKDNGPGYKTMAVDLNWNYKPEVVPESAKKSTATIQKPACLDEMITIARKLASPFPQVRVDLYEVNGKVYFGELTFTPGGGKKFTDDYLLFLGNKTNLSLAIPRKTRFIV